MWRAFIFTACWMLLASAAFAAPNQVPQTPDLGVNHRELRLGVITGEVSPYAEQDSQGNYSGITIDYAHALAGQLGVGLVLKSFSNEHDLLRALDKGDVDVIATNKDDEALSPSIGLTPPYSTEQVAMIERANEPRVASSSDKFRSLKVGITNENFAIVPKLQGLHPNWQFVRFQDTLRAMEALAGGQVNVVVDGMTTGSFAIGRLQITGLAIRPVNPEMLLNKHFGVELSNEKFLRNLNEAISKLPLDFILETHINWSPRPRTAIAQDQLELTEGEKAWIHDHPVVAYSSLDSFIPYTFKDKAGNAGGISIEVLNEISRITGLQFKPLFRQSRAEVLLDLENGTAKLTPFARSDIPLGNQFLLSTPYKASLVVIVSRKDGFSYKDLDDLRGKSVAISALQANEIQQIAAQRSIKTSQFSNTPKAFFSLSNGNVDAILVDAAVANYMIVQYYPNLVVSGFTGSHQLQYISMGVAKSQPMLAAILDKAIQKMPPGTLDGIGANWRPTSYPVQDWDRFRLPVIIGTLSVLAFSLVSLFWTILLKKEIRERSILAGRLENQLSFQKVLLNSLPFPVFVLDSDRLVLGCNEAYTRFMQMPVDQIVGKNFSEMGVTSELVKVLEGFYASASTEGEVQLGDGPIEVGGQHFDVYFWAAHFNDNQGKLAGVVGGWVDITERIQLENDLRRARDAADKANRAKSVFLSSMSHEIRTPLNVIIGLLELHMRRDEPTEKQFENLGTARDSARYLLSLIDDILDLSKIEAQRMILHPKPLNLREKLRNLVRMFEPMAAQKQIALDLEIIGPDDLWVNADPVRLRQVLANLLSNAIKFTKKGGVVLRCDARALDDHTIVCDIEVVDTGIGIRQEDMASLFQPFSQASHSATDEFNGTGLGLVISKRLVGLMGGHLLLKSEVGKGTTVRIEMSLKRATPAKAHLSSYDDDLTATCFPELHVLIVDDHRPNRIVLRAQLEQLGCVVTDASDGFDGLKKWQDGNFAVVITDYSMPGMTGLELTIAIRQQEVRLNIPAVGIIGLTAYVQPEIIQSCLEAGMSNCLIKPVELAGWVQALRAACPAAVSLERPLLPSPLLSVPNFAGPEFGTLNTLTAGNAISARHFLETLRQDDLEDWKNAEGALSEGKLDDLAKCMHKIQGPYKLLHLDEIVFACMEVEDLCLPQESANLVHISEAMQRLRLLLDTFIEKGNQLTQGQVVQNGS